MSGDLSDRVKDLFVPRDRILDLVKTDEAVWPEVIYLGRMTLPPGTRVLDVRDDHIRRGFVFRLTNESWPVVPPFGEVPQFDARAAPVEYRTYYRDQTKVEDAAADLVAALSALGYEAEARAAALGEWYVRYNESPYTHLVYNLHWDGKMFRSKFDTASGALGAGPTFVKRWK